MFDNAFVSAPVAGSYKAVRWWYSFSRINMYTYEPQIQAFTCSKRLNAAQNRETLTEAEASRG